MQKRILLLLITILLITTLATATVNFPEIKIIFFSSVSVDNYQVEKNKTCYWCGKENMTVIKGELITCHKFKSEKIDLGSGCQNFNIPAQEKTFCLKTEGEIDYCKDCKVRKIKAVPSYRTLKLDKNTQSLVLE